MNLEDAPKKQILEVVSILEGKLKEDSLRFGIEEGGIVTIVNKLPGGPVIIQRSQQQIAIGRELAKAIQVKIKK